MGSLCRPTGAGKVIAWPKRQSPPPAEAPGVCSSLDSSLALRGLLPGPGTPTAAQPQAEREFGALGDRTCGGLRQNETQQRGQGRLDRPLPRMWGQGHRGGGQPGPRRGGHKAWTRGLDSSEASVQIGKRGSRPSQERVPDLTGAGSSGAGPGAAPAFREGAVPPQSPAPARRPGGSASTWLGGLGSHPRYPGGNDLTGLGGGT